MLLGPILEQNMAMAKGSFDQKQERSIVSAGRSFSIPNSRAWHGVRINHVDHIAGGQRIALTRFFNDVLRLGA